MERVGWYAIVPTGKLRSTLSIIWVGSLISVQAQIGLHSTVCLMTGNQFISFEVPILQVIYCAWALVFIVVQQLGYCTHCVCNQSFSAPLCNISCAFSLDIMQTLDRYTQFCQNYTGRDESHLGLHYVLSHLQVNTGGGHKKK